MLHPHALSDPHFNEGLARHTQTLSFFVEAGTHPGGEIDIDPLDFQAGATRLGPVEVGVDVRAFVEGFIEFSRFLN